MSDAFDLINPDEAREYLDSFDLATRRKGEAYLREGRVGEIVCEEQGRRFVAPVRGSEPYHVEIYFDGEEWVGDCTCPVQVDCKHVYATLKALLAEHSVARVREISGGAVAPLPLVERSSGKARTSASLASMAATALERALRPDEIKFLRKLHEAYEHSRQTRQITRWDFQNLGLRLSGNTWEPLRIWPAFPETEHEFWLYVAKTAMDHRLTLPDFLAPITDVRKIEESLARWRRGIEVDRWKQTFSHLKNWNSADSLVSRGEYDLRLRFEEQAAHLEWKRPGRETFEAIKQGPLRRFTEDHRAGLIELSSEAELLWQSLQSPYSYGVPSLRFNEPTSQRMLRNLFRLRSLESHLINSAGQPFRRESEPLRWELLPAESDADDYRLRLARADGTPLPPFVATLPGQPPLYLTFDTVFSGPPTLDALLEAEGENVIPAPALETRSGLEFLQKLKIEPPPRLKDRIRHVPMEISIRCELRPIYHGSSTEDCCVQLLARSGDGLVEESWNGVDWVAVQPLDPAKGKKKAKADDSLVLYDRSLASEAPRWLEPLGLKSGGYWGSLSMRVTKKFPEIFVPWLKTLPAGIRLDLAGELASLAQEAVSGQVRLAVTETEMDWFDLRVVLDVSDTTLTKEELKLLLNARGAFVRLGSKGWRRLQFNLTEEEDERLARLGLNPRELSAEPQRLHALQLADDAAKKFLPAEQAVQIQRRAGEIKARVTPEIPSGIHAELRPYQLDGFHFLAYLSTNRFGGILADDMGLGKTLQTLTWLAWLREQVVVDADGKAIAPAPSLVVCPKSVMDNWRAEVEHFTPGLRIKVWPPGEAGGLLSGTSDADLHVINYSQLRLAGEGLKSVSWLAVILDEGQYIKNPSSLTAQIARSLRAGHRLVLSGTPIENRLLDLWSLMAFAMPGVLGSRNQFAKLFDAREDPFARRRLSARVRPFLLRRTKTQVAKDLPDRIEEDLFCEIEGEQKTLYRAELKHAQQVLLRIQTQKQLAQERFHLLTSLLRLRQICCHPALVKPGSKAASAKVEALLEQLEPLMEEGNKVLVFSQFVGMLDLLKETLAEKGWPLFYLAGSTENRGDLVRDFQAAEGAAVFLISLKAGGFGLNLTSASYVVLFDPWWNPAVENQAIDRTHRIGQKNNVVAYRLLIKNSIEEKIRALQKQKSAIADDVLGEEKFAQSLTMQDLQFLFAD